MQAILLTMSLLLVGAMLGSLAWAVAARGRAEAVTVEVPADDTL